MHVAYYQSSPQIVLLLVLVLVAATAFLMVTNQDVPIVGRFVLTASIDTLASCLLGWILLARAPARTYRRNEALMHDQRYEFSSEGMESAAGRTTAFIPWDGFTKVWLTHRFLALRSRAHLMVHCIPRQHLTEDQTEQVLAWASAAGGPIGKSR